jgi:hypothetical protein
MHGSRLYGLSAAVLLLNLLLLLFYQYYLHGDFPFQDEWGYVASLMRLPDTGFWQYIFSRHQTYHMPVLMFTWYLFYAWAHLDIMLIRYIGALVTALVALFLCILLVRKVQHRDSVGPLLILYAPFVICSYNFSGTYVQSIESVIQPFQFGMALVAAWAAENALQNRNVAAWTGLCVICALLGVGTYGSGLAILPAVAGANLLLRRRINILPMATAVIGLATIIWYVYSADSLSDAEQRPGLTSVDFMRSLLIWVVLTGNAIFSPALDSAQFIVYILGATIIAVQIAGLAHVLRLPAEQRIGCMVPVMLTLYKWLVFIEILFTRFHHPDVEFTPRYSILMLAGPVSALFYLMMLAGDSAGRRVISLGISVVLIAGTVGADVQIATRLPYIRNTLATVRLELMSLKGDPSPAQQAEMFVSPRQKPRVYPGRLFLESQGLAMYHESDKR